MWLGSNQSFQATIDGDLVAKRLFTEDVAVYGNIPLDADISTLNHGLEQLLELEYVDLLLLRPFLHNAVP